MKTINPNGMEPGSPSSGRLLAAPRNGGPLEGRSGRMLQELTGLPEQTYMAAVRVNLNARFTGKHGKGDRFDRCEAARRVRLIEPTLPSRVFLLGKAVSAAFGFK